MPPLVSIDFIIEIHYLIVKQCFETLLQEISCDNKNKRLSFTTIKNTENREIRLYLTISGAWLSS